MHHPMTLAIGLAVIGVFGLYGGLSGPNRRGHPLNTALLAGSALLLTAGVVLFIVLQL